MLVVWNNMRNAPRNGGRFLAKNKHGWIQIVHFSHPSKSGICSSIGRHWASESGQIVDELTGWMPLPETGDEFPSEQ